MSGNQRRFRPDLPTGDLPSPEVLDELLRAFAADATDAQARARIDLTSPEVDDLIAGRTPRRGPVAGPAASAAADVSTEEVDLDAPAAVADDVAEEALDDGPVGAAPPDEDLLADDLLADDVAPADEPLDLADEDVADDDLEVVDGVVDEVAEDVAEADDDAVAIDGAGDEADAHDGAGTDPARPRTVVIDASDELPDPVYLAAGDPLLAAASAARDTGAAATDDASPARGPVFIDDTAVTMGETISLADAAAATRIEPRLRERRIAVKRAAGRRRLRWVLIGTGVLAVIIAVLAVLGSSLFAIDRVRVDGAVYTDEAALQAVIEDLEGTPVLRADTDAAERRLEAIPWVASARVTTQFPHQATIELRERTPVATYQGPDGRFRVIDIEARVLDVVDGQPVDFLVITSPDAPNLDAGRFAPQGFVAAANLIQALTPELRALAESVSVTGNGSDLRMMLTEGREVRFGPGRDLVTKLVRLQTRLDQVDAGGFRYIDVSTDEVTTG
jgi:cell division protein FtsQ